MTDQTKSLLDAAAAAALKAYAPFSHLRVGAAVRTAGGAVYAGCNVENVAFPVGGCAEQHALAAAVLAEGPELEVSDVAVFALNANDDQVPIPPCGACRQRIREFGRHARVSFLGFAGTIETLAIADLLPHSFEF